MKKKRQDHLLWLGIGALFLATRWFVWVYRPMSFTDVIYSYMAYAHLWAGGETPYLEQWFEYPPATIPLFYLPHIIDMKTLTTSWHLTYLTAYRGILLLVDIGIFSLLILTLKKFKVNSRVLVGSTVFYLLATAKAHHFVYDSIDLLFAGAMLVSVSVPFLWPQFGGYLIGWLGYFTAVALKLVNAPLVVVYAALERKNWRRLVATVVLAGMIVWLVPLVYFRSSLLVIWVYHAQRGLQVESVPAQIAATINAFTRSERYTEEYKNYDITGPMSLKVKQVYDWLFPVALIGYLSWSLGLVRRSQAKVNDRLRISLTIGYIYTFMLFSKVLSTPFLLWQIPLVAVFPFKTLKQQLTFTLPVLFMIVISMTFIQNQPIGPFSLHLLIGWLRSLLIAYLLWQSVHLARMLASRGQ